MSERETKLAVPRRLETEGVGVPLDQPLRKLSVETEEEAALPDRPRGHKLQRQK